MRVIITLIFLLLSSKSEAQLCFVSSPFGGEQHQILPSRFIQLEEDFEFQDVNKRPYTRLFVAVPSLNVRNSPNYGRIVGTLFQGDKVPILARKGNWVAITKPIPNFKNKPQWVHISYLSPSRINTISTENLMARCKFNEMANMLEKSHVTDNCKSVRNFVKSNDNFSARKYKFELLNFLKVNDKIEALQKVQSNCF